jgi:hypothetical protein
MISYVQCNIAHVPNEHHEHKRKSAKNEKSESTSFPQASVSLMMKQTFKLNAETIQVVAKSDLPMEIWQQPMLPTNSLTWATHTTASQQQPSELDPLSLFNIVDEGLHLEQQQTMQASSEKTEHHDIMMRINDIDWSESDKSADEQAKSKKSKGKHAL